MRSSILTVTTSPAATRTLIALEALKADLGITTSDQDAVLNSLIASASAAVETYCNRIFALDTLSEQIRQTCLSENPLALTRYPVVSIASVTADGTVLTGDDYEPDLATGLLTRLSSDAPICWSERKIVVAYTAGYDLPTGLPADIARACSMLAAGQWYARGRDPMTKRVDIPDVREVEYWVGSTGDQSPGFPDEVAALLDVYRSIRVY